MLHQWKHSAVCFSTMHLLASNREWTWEGCGIGKQRNGLSSTSMAPDRPHDNVLYLRGRICHHRNGVCLRSVRPATRGASVGRSCAPGPRSYRPIPISGSSPVEQPAMEIIEASCYGDSP